MPPIICCYKDNRNMYQAKATRTRVQNDIDEFQEQNKWLEWSNLTALIAKLRSDWDKGLQSVDVEKPAIVHAHYLHDMLLLLWSRSKCRGPARPAHPRGGCYQVLAAQQSVTMKSGRQTDEQPLHRSGAGRSLDGRSNGNNREGTTASGRCTGTTAPDVTELITTHLSL